MGKVEAARRKRGRHGRRGSLEGLEVRCNIEEARGSWIPGNQIGVGKVFRVADYARLHRQMRSSENSSASRSNRSIQLECITWV